MRPRSAALVVSALSVLASCGMDRSNVAYGTPTSIIVISTDQVWESLRDSLQTALEPLVFTVRAERAFNVTHVRPDDPQTRQFRKFRQLLVIGRPLDSWVEPALARADGAPDTLPALVETDDVWALGQHVTAIVLDPDQPASGGLAVLDAVRQGVDERFRFFVLQKMYVSGVNEGLAERLLLEAGFALTLPRVYRAVPAEGVHVFKNDLPDPSQLARYVLIQQVEGTPPEPTVEALVDWRDSIDVHYPRLMVSVREDLHQGTLEDGVFEVQGRWETPPPDPDSDEAYYPGGGAFISRLVRCPDDDRAYLLDSWLYAPGKDKLEYIMQLRTILSTFRCGDVAAGRTGVALR
ncbi:MAG TPA: hypothetical protein VML95_07260 [Longimicrobiales bacterium]|nr:hypothetical protein [Longimicrobiales bacterium]